MRILNRSNCRGFTLFELLAVMMILSILASIAVPSYQRSQIRAREAVLAENLYQMRKAVDAFYADLGRYPDHLDQLTEYKYLRDIPADPFTRNKNSWNCIPPDMSESGNLEDGGCYDVFSGSDLIGLNDIPYRDW